MAVTGTADDLVAWVALLHRGVMVRLARTSGRPIMGCGQGAVACSLPNRWRRRCREVDVVAGWVRKLTPERVEAFLSELDTVLGPRPEEAVASSDAREAAADTVRTGHGHAEGVSSGGAPRTIGPPPR